MGAHEFVLTVTDPNTGCSQESQPYPVTVHNLPPQPTVTANIIDCSTYEIELTANITNSSAYLFNWSNGESGINITIHHGGAYQVEMTDEYGCRSHTDKNIPYDPSYYFWRFPLGCYSFCPEDLPRQIDGTWNISFEQWTWYYYSNVVNNNGNYNSTGIATPSDPLIIAEQSFGDGPGGYSWELENEYCSQTTDIMEWDVEECCELDMSGLEIECGALPYTYEFIFEVNLANCSIASFSIDVLSTLGYVTSAYGITPLLLNTGPNQVTGTFDMNNFINIYNTLPQGVTLFIDVICDEHCHASMYQFLPPCDWPPLDSAQPISTGNNEQAGPSLSIMPNPARSSIWVEYGFLVDSTATGTQRYQLSINDATGRQTMLVDLDGPTGKRYIDTSTLQPGIYIIEMRDGTAGVHTKRIVIIK